MPCRDGGYYDAQDRQIEEFEQMLCSACRTLERLGYDFDENPQLSRWWNEHKELDEKEQLRVKVARDLAKKPWDELTKDERFIVLEYLDY